MELVETKLKEIASCENDVNLMASQIYVLCTNLTPQFYRNLSAKDMQAEITSIKLIVNGIEPTTLAKMCEMAIAQYPKDKSENEKTFFNINYVLKFYKQAYNLLHCDYILLNKGAKLISRQFDNTKSIMYEKWQNGDQIVDVSCVTTEEEGTHKDFEAQYGIKWRPPKNELRIYDFSDEELKAMFDNLDEVEL